MKENYPVLFGKNTVGKIQMRKQGLYWHFDCHCRLSGDVLCRLVAIWEDGQENLGIPVPGEDGFVLQTKIPQKRIGNNPAFFLLPKAEAQGTFVPITPEEPFAYIVRLKNSYLSRKGNQLGIYI